MRLPASANNNLTLEQVKAKFEDWRKTRGKRRAIPNTLWKAAVSLAPKYPLYQISKALHLHYTGLKNRVQERRSSPVASGVCSPAFIELGLCDQMRPAECIVEMENQSGAKMRMYFEGEAGLDLLELARAFWGKRS